MSKDYGYDLIKEHFKSRKNLYTGFEIPKDSTLIEIKELIKANKLQDVSDLLAQSYGIKSAKIILNDEKGSNSFLVYNFINEEIILYTENLQNPIEKLYALLLGFFEHLSSIKSWKFHEDLELSHIKQREEAKLFAKKIMDRYVSMGVLAKK
ncbi:MAG: hypothetical protein QXD42_06745 [Nitrososphaerales archaeon]